MRGTADEQLRRLQQVDAIPKLYQKALDNVTPSVKWLASQRLVSAALQLAEFEEVGLMDPYERLRPRMEAQRDQPNATARFAGALRTMATASIADGRKVNDAVNSAEKKTAETLPVIYPVVDGRLKDINRSK